MWWHAALGILGGLALLYLVLLVLLWRYARTHPEAVTLREALRLLPDLLRLLRRLATDPAVPRSTRIWLVLLLVYLASPIDLIPDFVPVVGYADDAMSWPWYCGRSREAPARTRCRGTGRVVPTVWS